MWPDRVVTIMTDKSDMTGEKDKSELGPKPIFSRQENIDRIAFLNWRMDSSGIQNLLSMADGFMLSAIYLAKLCLANNGDKKADIVIFPILTNANHGIELYLKGMTWILNKLLDIDNKVEGKHNIDQIYRTVKSKIQQLDGADGKKNFEKETKELRDYITELFAKVKSTPKDDKMDFSRYPFSNKYENHFYADRIGNVEVDLDNFVNRFEIIREKLDNISSFYYYQRLNQDW